MVDNTRIKQCNTITILITQFQGFLPEMLMIGSIHVQFTIEVINAATIGLVHW